MLEPRRPRDVPDVDPLGPDDLDGLGDLVLDTDGDGRPDTSVTDDGVDLVLGTDLDADGVVDQILRIGPDGVVRTEQVHPMLVHPELVHDLW